MNTQQVLDAIDDALGKHDGSEMELMEAVCQKAESWKMRREELIDEAEEE